MEQVPAATRDTSPVEATVQTDEVEVENDFVPEPADAVALIVGPVPPKEYDEEYEDELIVRVLAV